MDGPQRASLIDDALHLADVYGANVVDCYWALRANPITDASVPASFREAMSGPDAERWGEAAKSEIGSLLENNTWELVPRTPGMKVLPSRWVLKIKTDSQGLPERYKCRLVAGGHRQKFGIDFEETFAPVGKNTTQRVIVCIAARYKWTVRQLDVSTAFLHGEIDKEIFMEQPEGFVEGKGLVCKLTKCLYGLKQAPRAWFAKLTDFLRELHFTASVADPNLWMGDWKGCTVYIVIVVDDTLMCSADVRATMEVEQEILKKFPGRSGLAEWYCGMKLDWQMDGSVRVTQEAHVVQLLAKHHLEDLPVKGLPMPHKCKLTAAGEPLNTERHPYASIVGSLLYIACNTRPDIASTVNKLTKYMSDPKTQHWEMLMYLLGYLKATKSMGLHLGKSDLCTAYCDSDFASDLDTRRSHTGWCFLLYGGVISWQSKCQPTVAASTTEAEYQAASAAAREALWLRQLFTDLKVPCTPLEIKCDNLGALSSLNNPQITQRTKHIDVIHHFVRERCQLGQLKYTHVPSQENVADVLTKPLPKDSHSRCCEQMGMW